jgi:uncharacterized protein (TIGR02246 family)
MKISITPSTAPPSDATALVTRVADLERAQLAEDVDGFMDLFDEDAVWVSAGGRRLIGREAIAEFTAKVLPGAFVNGSVRFDVDHIRFITPDAALTGVNQEYLDVEGRSLSPRREGRPSYLWLLRSGQWRIAYGQNTPVPTDDMG